MVLLFSLAGKANAVTPTVSNVSGTVSTGQTLAVAGTNMLDENTTNWQGITLSQSRCQGTSPTADGWDASNGGSYTSSQYLTGTKSLYFAMQGPGPCCSENPICASGPGVCNSGGGYVYRSPSAPIMYARAYVRYSPNYPFGNLNYNKMIYWMQAGVYVQPATSQYGSLAFPTQMDVKIQGNDTLMNLPSQWVGDRWYCVEAMADNTNDRAQVWIDGQSIGTFNGALAQNPFSFLVGIINASCLCTAGTFEMWADSVALSTSRIYPVTMVEIGNGSNYASAVKVKQELLRAADGSIQIKSDLTGLGAGPYYLFVTNNRQERSAAYPLLGGGDTTVPGAPRGLLVH